MEWICIGLSVLCIALITVTSRCRREWQFEREMRRHLQEEYKIVCNSNLELKTQNKELVEIKNLAEQRYEDERKLRMEAELKARQLEMKLPRRDSKGRYCKK